MATDIISASRGKIALVSAISALAGAANIWLLALITRYVHVDVITNIEIAEFALALALMVGINSLSQIMLSRLSARTFYNLREQLIRGITHLTSQQREAIGSNRLYTALTKDVPAIHDLVIFLPNYVFNFTVAIACLIYLLTVSVTLWLVFVVFLVISLGVAKFAIADRAEPKFLLRRKIEDDLFKSYEAVIEGSKELQMNRAREEQFIQQDLRSHAKDYRDTTVLVELYWNMSNNWSSALIFIGVGALLLVSSSLGSGNRADGLGFVVVIFYMVGPLTILMNSFRTIQAAKTGFTRLNDLQLDASIRLETACTDISGHIDSISLKAVRFEYESPEEGRNGFTVGPLDLDITRGEIVYFIGGNGSGKTTAAKLLTGLYEKQSGNILVNGKEIPDRNQYFQIFSAIFQDYYLFESIVPKGPAQQDDAAVQAMIDKLKLTDKVTVKNGRLSTIRLSHGQRKRLALLVAYFDNSEVYVFDEWAADQDPEFREFFYKTFLIELKNLGKTAVVVSHDDRYFHLADRLVKFEGGQIVSIIGNKTAFTLPTTIRGAANA